MLGGCRQSWCFLGHFLNKKAAFKHQGCDTMSCWCSCLSSQLLKPGLCPGFAFFKTKQNKSKQTKANKPQDKQTKNPKHILKYVFSYYNIQEKWVKDILGKLAFLSCPAEFGNALPFMHKNSVSKAFCNSILNLIIHSTAKSTK